MFDAETIATIAVRAKKQIRGRMRGLRLALIRPLRKGETEPLIALQKEAQKAFEAAPEKAAMFAKRSRSEGSPTAGR